MKHPVMSTHAAKLWAGQSGVRIHDRRQIFTSYPNFQTDFGAQQASHLTFKNRRSPTEILGSNPTGGMDICLL
jgi:hypothetical protein